MKDFLADVAIFFLVACAALFFWICRLFGIRLEDDFL